ncbi:hypothetical protein OEZ85_008877 [Tetradesmus obliquus]|uniref:Deacetylase sirtuin-type domain-containing protein n=1 Tax=Tetradesmus obliquus TaxID=3088 RepID=A0ABY8TK25_TETOB|nr:hypothetical protein OEZ85_008877 [Tetradesmus obliquus]
MAAKLLASRGDMVLASAAACKGQLRRTLTSSVQFSSTTRRDYRGPGGAYTTGFTPMTHQQFMAKPENRSRYWARSFAGWHEFAFVQPNAAHEAIARLQGRGWLDLVITQNVDRLHHKGGSGRVLELHGTTHRVVCMDCGHSSCRHEVQQRLADLNPHMAAAVRHASSAAAAAAGGGGISNRGAYERALRVGTAADARKVAAGADAEQVPVVRPDGDIELGDAGRHFRTAACAACGGQVLKPDVVFFGDSVPKGRVESALSAVQSSDLLLVVGSSLMVWSAFRLVKAAKAAGAALAIVNVGPTRADDLADVKVEALAGEVCMQLAMHPSLLVPRVA